METSDLWDFDDPEASLARFTAAAGRADEPERSVLLTQAARAHGLAGRFTSGRRILDSLDAIDREVAVRRELEHGRLCRSQALATGEAGTAAPLLAHATTYFERAAVLADRQDDLMAGLHLDALHMLALLPEDPGTQVAATRRALAAAEQSPFPSARRWVAPLLNNLGMALHDAGDDRGALDAFTRAVAERRREGDRRALQIALWCQAWSLRLVGRTDEALAMQRDLRDQLRADGIDDRYVTEELALLGEDG